MVKDIVDGKYLVVHYLGWGDEWDEAIDLDNEPERIAEAGTMTNVDPSSNDNIKKSGSQDEQNRPRVTKIQAAKGVRRSFDDRIIANNAKAILDKKNATTSSHNGKSIRVSTRRSSVNSISTEDSNRNIIAIPVQTHSQTSRNYVYGNNNVNNNHGAVASSVSDSNTIDSNHNLNNADGEYYYINDNDAMSDSELNALLEMEKAFEKKLLEKGMHIVEVSGDGNCLFRAVSHQLYGTDSYHLELRRQCVQHMKEHKERFFLFCESDFDKYLATMRIPGTWGSEMEIRALEEITNMFICIYASTDTKRVLEPMKTNFDDLSMFDGGVLEFGHPMLLSYHGNNHYNSIFNEKNPLPLQQQASTSGKTILQIREDNSNNIE
jgi:hypothetical protein